mmetsp:Transcript_40697/g.56692  ORF Transcript_40697/g.56692 Transcript_40697/m.56692 type:complete len:201 (-) Transcript_40697:54-656(-)
MYICFGFCIYMYVGNTSKTQIFFVQVKNKREVCVIDLFSYSVSSILKDLGKTLADLVAVTGVLGAALTLDLLLLRPGSEDDGFVGFNEASTTLLFLQVDDTSLQISHNDLELNLTKSHTSSTGALAGLDDFKNVLLLVDIDLSGALVIISGDLNLIRGDGEVVTSNEGTILSGEDTSAVGGVLGSKMGSVVSPRHFVFFF